MSAVLVAPITPNFRLAEAPGNGRLTRRQSKLPLGSLNNVSQVPVLHKRYLCKRASRLSVELLTEA